MRALNSYLAKSKVLNKGDFYDRTVAMNSLDGKLLALPNTLSLYVLYFNKNLFAERGLKVPDLTWDYAADFDDAVQKLTRRRGTRSCRRGWRSRPGGSSTTWAIRTSEIGRGG